MFPAIVAVVLVQVSCIDFFINRTLTCRSLTASGQCAEWMSTGSISRPAPKCFPAHTLVLTQQGPKAMAHLRVGDHILGYNEATQQNQYTEVTAWLHRITNKKFEYIKIKTKTASFHSSSKHNIAVRDDSKTIGYVFGRDLLNHTLVSADSREDLRVVGIQNDIALGVYSPYTELSNYYILGDNVAQPLRKHQNTLLLVHCFAEVSNPMAYDVVFGAAMHMATFLGYSEQPKEDSYVHPLSRWFSHMFPVLVDDLNDEVVHQDLTLLDAYITYRTDQQNRRMRQLSKVINSLNMIMEGPALLFQGSSKH